MGATTKTIAPILKEVHVPKVGGKHYAYSTSGKAAAKAEAKRTGKLVTHSKKK